MVQEGRIEQSDAHSLICSLGEFGGSIERRMEALGEVSLGTFIHGGRKEA
jgi:hypothetical protein